MLIDHVSATFPCSGTVTLGLPSTPSTCFRVRNPHWVRFDHNLGGVPSPVPSTVSKHHQKLCNWTNFDEWGPKNTLEIIQYIAIIHPLTAQCQINSKKYFFVPVSYCPCVHSILADPTPFCPKKKRNQPFFTLFFFLFHSFLSLLLSLLLPSSFFFSSSSSDPHQQLPSPPPSPPFHLTLASPPSPQPHLTFGSIRTNKKKEGYQLT